MLLTWRRTLLTSTSRPRSSQAESSEEDPDPAENVRDAILHEALQFVPEHGWSRKAIVKGTEAAGYPAVTNGVFTRGGIDLVFHFYASANKELVLQFEEEHEAVEKGIIEKKKINTFIRDAVEMRLRLLSPYISTWPQAMGMMALPTNACEALGHLATLTDDIWYHAGDRSVDFNYYTKRASLAAIYKATELHMVQDGSDDFQETWHFLDRRLGDLSSFGKCVRQASESTDKMGDLVWSSFLTARNLIGMNDRQR